MKYAQIRTALLTFALGIVSIPFFTTFYDKWNILSVDVPKVVSKTPILIGKQTDEKHLYKDGGGGSGGRTCEDFIKSLHGKLTKKALAEIADSPCHNLRLIPGLNNKSFQK